MPVISTVDQLELLTRRAPPMVPGRTVRLELGTLDAAEKERWERKLSRRYGACGCKAGAIALFGFVASFSTGLLLGHIDPSAMVFVWLLGGSVLASVAGKVLGMFTGLILLRIAVRRLSAMTTPTA